MANGQLNLSPMEVRKSEQAPAAFRKSEHEDPTFRKSEQDSAAAEFFDTACRAANLESKDVAHLLSVSVSLVDKWRSPDQRGCPSFVQLLMLPPRFHFELHRQMNRKFGFGRAALRDILDSLGTLAAVGDW